MAATLTGVLNLNDVSLFLKYMKYNNVVTSGGTIIKISIALNNANEDRIVTESTLPNSISDDTGSKSW